MRDAQAVVSSTRAADAFLLVEDVLVHRFGVLGCRLAGEDAAQPREPRAAVQPEQHEEQDDGLHGEIEDGATVVEDTLRGGRKDIAVACNGEQVRGDEQRPHGGRDW
ncbi:hypothetical protein NLG97_g10331 [Lecanicillium saksenae]|uniref:Uncharacterized protein n=1 Tax=Lecanicillium saksenae TaxID=468837 RepID=A0ACC1QFH6_9HYPO|nr:hypothetical protein NLG97_g10331 [Lecanicillium saksenae]